MVDQVSHRSDERLHELAQDIGFATYLLKEGEARKDGAWDEVLSIFSEHNARRFIANDGFYLHKEIRSGRSELNWAELKEEMRKFFGDKFTRMWNRVTVASERTGDSFKLERQVNLGNIPIELVQLCTHTAPDGYARVRREWSQEDYNRAVIFDVKLDPDVKAKQIALLEAMLAELKGETIGTETAPTA